MKTTFKKTAIIAGMQFKTGKTVNNKLHKVGFYVTQFVTTNDGQLISEKQIKRVIF